MEIWWRKLIEECLRVLMLNSDWVGRVVPMVRGIKMQFQSLYQRSPELSCKDVTH